MVCKYFLHFLDIFYSINHFLFCAEAFYFHVGNFFFLDMMPKVHAIKANIDKWDYINAKFIWILSQ